MVEARRKRATQLREQARSFVDLYKTLQRATAEKDQTVAHLAEYRKREANFQNLLEQARKAQPEIQANTVTIYPVKWDDAGPGN